MNLSADNPLEPEQQIWIQIDTEGLKMKAKGKVVRCRARRISDLKTYSMGIKFIDITERDRDRIIRFVFKKLTDMRKKVLNDECGI
jgi:c-di-GMP-binding flagellar brake protein YcgR